MTLLKRFSCRAFARHVLCSALLAGLAPAAWAQTAPAGSAVVADAKNLVLNQPALMTPRALHGVYNDIAHAGSRLVAVGERGWILLSDDNGVSWRQIPSPTSVILTKVSFGTAQDGWAVGGMGVVLHSTDGGLSWKLQLDGAQAATVAFNDATAAANAAPNNAVATQNLQSAQQLVQSGPTEPFLAVLASSAQNVLIGGAFGMGFSSSDGGASWQSLATEFPNPDGLHIYSILQQDRQIYLVGEQGLVLAGKPGAPLATIAIPFQGTLFGQLITPDHSWIAYGLQGTVLRSPDAGAHWAQAATTSQVGIDCGVLLRNGVILLGDVGGELLLSHDDGKNFTTIPAGPPVLALAQADDGAVVAATPAGMRRIPAMMLAAGQ